MKPALRIIQAEFVKWIKITFSYPLEILGYVLFPVVWVLPFVYQGKALAGGMTSPHFAKYAGTPEYLPYVLIGAIVSTYVFTSLYGMAGSLRYESYCGTLEYLFIAPCRKIFLLLGLALQDSVTATLIALSQGILLVWFFGVSFSAAKIFPILLITVLLIAGLYGMGLGIAGLTLRVKETRQLTRSLEQFFFIFSPIRYPVEVNPFIRLVSLAIPLTYALVALRATLLLNKPLSQLWSLIGMLAAMDFAMIAGGWWVFKKVEKRARADGTIGTH